MKSSRQGFLNDMAEHRPILKNNQITYFPRFHCTPKTGIEFPKTGVLFLLCSYNCLLLLFIAGWGLILHFIGPHGP